MNSPFILRTAVHIFIILIVATQKRTKLNLNPDQQFAKIKIILK